MGRHFPIPREDLPHLEVCQQEHDDGKQIMKTLLDHTLREFEEFAYDRKGVVDNKRWKPTSSHEDLNMYRERTVGATTLGLSRTLQHCNVQSPTFACTAATLSPPTMMLTGWGPGRVEDAMSAVVTESQQDLSLVVTYMHQDVADCAVVHTLEPPTDDAPYHYLGYKYFVMKSPTNGLLAKHRDSLYLEYCGMTTSSTGETIGFHLMQSVEIPQFPDLSGHNSIRALQSSRYLYRQKSDRIVEVFMLGNMDISGMIVKPIANMFSTGAQFGVTRLLDLAEVRRLTEMARTRRQYRGLLSSGALDHSSSQYSSASTYVPGEGCTVCKRSKTSKCVECHLCGHSVCQRCRSTKRVWVSDSAGIMGCFRKIQACSACVLRANTGTYEPPAQRVRSHQGSMSTNSSASDHSSRSTSDPTLRLSVAFNGVLYEEEKVPRRQHSPEQRKRMTRRRPKVSSPVETHAPRGPRTFVHLGEAVYPDAAEVATVVCSSPEYEVPNRVGLRPPQSTQESRSYPERRRTPMGDTGYSLSLELTPEPSAYRKKASFEGVSSEQASMMSRLLELTNMAEATSYRTQANGIYLAQQMQQQFKVQMTADWRK